MDTGDGEDLLKGSTKLVAQFSKLCSLTNLVHVMPVGYPRELLSNRLQGDEVKEGLAIAILLMHKMANPGKPP